MAEYDVNEILKKDGFDDIDLGNGNSIEFSKLDKKAFLNVILIKSHSIKLD